MNVLGVIIVLSCIMVVMAGSRLVAILGVLVSICYITQGQMIDVGGFHFTAGRIVLLFAIIRVFARGETTGIQLNKIDKVFLAFAIFSCIAMSIRVGSWKEQIGNAYNMLLSYFVFRYLIKDSEDFMELLPKLAVLIVPLAGLMLYESLTGNNVFNIFGGQGSEWMRDGRVRCIGSFRGPHTAGIFGATMIPFFVGLYFSSSRQRGVAICGLLSATVITYTSNSSGPLMGYLSALIGLVFWRVRTHMKRVRMTILGALLILSVVMKAPLWYVFAKISDITGGDGWYRSYLMEQCFNHISTWWFYGTDNTGTWGATQMEWGGADLCNIFVACAANAGLGSVVLFTLILVGCFSKIGSALVAARESVIHAEIPLWCLGSALFAHIMSLLSVTYFDQIHEIWWGLLGIIASATSVVLNHKEIYNIVPTDEMESAPQTMVAAENAETASMNTPETVSGLSQNATHLS